MDRRQREAARLKAKRKNPTYLDAERKRQKARMRKRRLRPEYQALERAAGWWTKR